MFWQKQFNFLNKMSHSSLNIARRGLGPWFSERAFNFASKSAFFARLQLFECLGWNKNANAFSLHPDEKVLTQHFFGHLGSSQIAFTETFSIFLTLCPFLLAMTCIEGMHSPILGPRLGFKTDHQIGGWKTGSFPNRSGRECVKSNTRLGASNPKISMDRRIRPK